MQDYVTLLPLAALLIAHAVCVAAVVSILGSRPRAYPGWRLVAPSGTHWFCFVGSWAFGALMSWIWLFVGSARADAEFQMQVALLLAIAFVAGAAWCGFQIAAVRRMALRWRGDAICWQENARELRQGFARFDALRRRLDGAFEIRFADGSVLWLDFYARNASEFLARISEEIGADVY